MRTGEVRDDAPTTTASLLTKPRIRRPKVVSLPQSLRDESASTGRASGRSPNIGSSGKRRSHA